MIWENSFKLMNQEQLLEVLHKDNDQRLEKLNDLIDKVQQERNLMMMVVCICATNAPHKIERQLGVFTDAPCLLTCPTCIAKRFLTNSLTENDLKLLKGEK